MNKVNTCVSIIAREMIQSQRTFTDVDVRPMHSISICALDEHQLQRAIAGFESFFSQKRLTYFFDLYYIFSFMQC